MKDYRTATSADYPYILRQLVSKNAQGVLVRSLLRPEKELYPLLEISKGEYTLSPEGVAGFSMDGRKCTLRISPHELHYVELKYDEGEWVAPELSSVILLVPSFETLRLATGDAVITFDGSHFESENRPLG